MPCPWEISLVLVHTPHQLRAPVIMGCAFHIGTGQPCFSLVGFSRLGDTGCGCKFSSSHRGHPRPPARAECSKFGQLVLSCYTGKAEGPCCSSYQLLMEMAISGCLFFSNIRPSFLSFFLCPEPPSSLICPSSAVSK